MALFFVTHRDVATLKATAHMDNSAIIIDAVSATHNDHAVTMRTALMDGTAITERACVRWENAAAAIATTAHVIKCA